MLRSILPIVRGFTSTTIRTIRRDGNRKPRDMAGVRIQQSILNNVDTLEEDPEMTYEADFTKLHLSHRQHETEMELQKEQLKYYTVRSKYFKSKKQPQFLTWAEKEQIRHLNKTNPDEWTPSRLAESFPAVEEVIIKVLKANWTPANLERVKKHDEAVKRNWKQFKANEMKDLDPEVSEHLQKFSNRNFDSTQNAYVQTNIDQTTFQFPKPKSNEFSHIISTCKRIDADANKELIGDKPKYQIEENKMQELSSDAPVLKLPYSMRKRVLTFEELKAKAKSGYSKTQDDEVHLSVSLLKEPAVETQSNVVETPAIAESHAIETFSAEIDKNNVAEIDTYPDESKSDRVVNLTLADVSSSKKITKYASKPLSSLATFKKDVSIPFRRKIEIPQRLQKHGSVYKLYDCFYDDRGEFLYRVPGLRN
ncbi:uncharacterized protein LOC129580278 [Sitodiplosis mosellana]|uniref:uncharacterized protein LOC129580278 n=1 Tax=Sitodiplosis mosellana TaxID=263140 RepID=UPI002444CA90|nr:uncharacterized protein LOC129580278 [Sitodiplosis mosellana]XP_055326522.1 uncharacterized protein LOC129580278 [Sitodiplosis mosellana]